MFINRLVIGGPSLFELWDFFYNFCQLPGLDIIPSVIKVYMVYV